MKKISRHSVPGKSWLDCQAKDIFPNLYYRSGIRPEAVQKLSSPEMAEKSRYILKIWSSELLQHLHQKTDIERRENDD